MHDTLSLVWPERFGRDDYIVTDSNRMAFDLVTNTAVWRGPCLCVVGPVASGKTHLARIFQNADPSHVAIDHADSKNNNDLFHMYNDIAAQGGKIAFFMTLPPAEWVTLPDLLSRLNAGMRATIDNPDEKTMAVIYRKLFADRGMAADDAAIAFLVARSARSYAAIRAAVARLDHLSMASGRAPTRPFVSSVLEKLFD